MSVSKAPELAKTQPTCAAARTTLCIHFTTDDQLSVGIIIGGISFIFGFVLLICCFISSFIFGVLFDFGVIFGFVFGFVVLI